MIVELLQVGTELLMGNIINTNAAYLSRRLCALGCYVYHQTVVGDNEERLTAALQLALSRSDLVILTGGLGPTKDDLTKEVVAKTIGESLQEDATIKQQIQNYFTTIGVDQVPENNWKQAQVIAQATVIPNKNGTAPGLWVTTKEKKQILLLPGPPEEMEAMFQDQIEPQLQRQQETVLLSKTVKICGIGESKLEMMIQDLIEQQTNPTIAPYAKTGEVHLRVTANAKTKQEAENRLQPVINELQKRFGIHCYTTEEAETLEAHVIALLKEKQFKLVTAESCTGGLLTATLVNVPGASAVLEEGFITYSNAAKEQLLQVNHQTLQEHGAVSEAVAKEMAFGAQKQTKAQVSVAVTGIAGPDGGTKEKPVGLIYVACAVGDHCEVQKLQLHGMRQKIRQQCVMRALDFVRCCLLKSDLT